MVIIMQSESVIRVLTRISRYRTTEERGTKSNRKFTTKINRLSIVKIHEDHVFLKPNSN